MTLILETGTGVPDANSYVTSDFVTTYLTNLNRVTENNWSTSSLVLTDAACVAASQYLDVRWGPMLKGVKDVGFVGQAARAVLTVSGQPSPNDTLVVSTTTFTFVSTLDDFNDNEIEIGSDVESTIDNIVTSINNDGQVIVEERTGTTDQILLVFPVEGTSGNDTPLNADSATNVVVTNSFQNGIDAGSQPLEFPREGLVDRSGRLVVGIPRPWKEAASEYAVRALGSSLFVDPTTDATGRVVQEKFEKVGPLEERTVYAEGAAIEQLIKPYPLADFLIREYVKSPGVLR